MHKKFWDFVKDTNKVTTLEEAFVEWTKHSNLDLNSAKVAWENINLDLKDIFSERSAEAPPVTQGAEGPSPLVGSVEQSENTDNTTLIKGVLTA